MDQIMMLKPDFNSHKSHVGRTFQELSSSQTHMCHAIFTRYSLLIFACTLQGRAKRYQTFFPLLSALRPPIHVHSLPTLVAPSLCLSVLTTSTRITSLSSMVTFLHFTAVALGRRWWVHSSHLGQVPCRQESVDLGGPGVVAGTVKQLVLECSHHTGLHDGVDDVTSAALTVTRILMRTQCLTGSWWPPVLPRGRRGVLSSVF